MAQEIGTGDSFEIGEPTLEKVNVSEIEAEQEEDKRYIYRIFLDTDSDLRMSYEAEIKDLADSIKENGLINPLVLLRKSNGRYRIVCGYRRYLALKKLVEAGEQVSHEAEAKIYDEEHLGEEERIRVSLAENTKRRSLNPVGVGHFLHMAKEYHKGQGDDVSEQKLAEKYGRHLEIGGSQGSVNHYLKMDKLRRGGESQTMINDVMKGELPFMTAVELSSIRNATDRNALYDKVVKPLKLTRKQVGEIKASLAAIKQNRDLAKKLGNSVSSIVESEEFKQAVESAKQSSKKGEELINRVSLLLNEADSVKQRRIRGMVETLKAEVCGERSSDNDFDVVLPPKLERPEIIVQFKITENSLKQSLQRMRKFPTSRKQVLRILEFITTTPSEIEEKI